MPSSYQDNTTEETLSRIVNQSAAYDFDDDELDELNDGITNLNDMMIDGEISETELLNRTKLIMVFKEAQKIEELDFEHRAMSQRYKMSTIRVIFTKCFEKCMGLCS